jgi:2'-hydroxyisoflavone reductase
VRHLTGNRDPRIAPGLVALAAGEWDAAIDLSGYVPRCVEASSATLEDSVGHYTFVSSVSVYADVSRPGVDETAPVAQLEDPASEDIPCALLARSRRAARQRFARRSARARSSCGRDSSWVRSTRPTDSPTGSRASSAPISWAQGTSRRSSRRRRIALSKFIDARDLASWMLDMAERKEEGTFDACTPAGMWTMGTLVEHLAASARAARSQTVARWVDDAILARHGVTPWTGLPLWIPATDAESAGFMHLPCARAIAQGLAFRPLSETIDDTAAWLRERDNSTAWRSVLSAATEREILADATAAPAPQLAGECAHCRAIIVHALAPDRTLR